MTIYRDPRAKGEYLWGSLILVFSGAFLAPLFWLADSSLLLTLLFLPFGVAGIYFVCKGIEAVRADFNPYRPYDPNPSPHRHANDPPDDPED